MREYVSLHYCCSRAAYWYIYICVYVCVHVYGYVCVHVYVYAYMDIHVYDSHVCIGECVCE